MRAFLAKRAAPSSRASRSTWTSSSPTSSGWCRRPRADFAKNEVLPKAAEIDREHRHPTELVARMAELGLLGIAVPEQYGGAGFDTVSLRAGDGGDLARLRVDRRDHERQQLAGLRSALQVRHRGAEAGVADAARVGQAARLLRAVRARGRLATPRRRRPSPKQDGDDCVINGIKNWITNGPVADVCVLFTMTDPATGHKGITAFILPMNDEGRAHPGRPTRSSASAARSRARSSSTTCACPTRIVLGEVGGGFKVAMSTLDGGRIGIAAQALGIARAALEDALALRARAQDLRQADRAAPGDPVQARRHGHRDRRGAPAHAGARRR